MAQDQVRKQEFDWRSSQVVQRMREQLIEERARLQCLVDSLDEEIFKLAPPVCGRPMTETETILSEETRALSEAIFRRMLSEPNYFVELLKRRNAAAQK